MNSRLTVAKTAGNSRLSDGIFSNLTLVFGFIIVAILLGSVVILAIDASTSIKLFSWSFLTGTSWNAVTSQFGALPAIFGTLFSSLS